MSEMTSLDRAQTRAVRSKHTVALIVGGPGTGKSEVVAHRAAHLIKGDRDPTRIVVFVANHAAGRLMRERIEAAAGGAQPDLIVTTPRRHGSELLGRHAPKLGRSEQYVIHDRGDAVQLMTELLRERASEEIDAEEVVDLIWTAKASLLSPKGIELLAQTDVAVVAARVFDAYDEGLRDCDAFDRQDLACKAVEVIESVDGALEEESQKIEHLIVDDYQDLSPAECRLVEALSSQGSLFVCGNEDQSIMDGTAAEPVGMFEFKERHRDAGEIELNRCYRGSKTVVEAANEVIARNRKRRSKLRTAAKKGGNAVRVLESWNERAEASDIEKSLRDLQSVGIQRSDIVILARTVEQFRTIRDLLRKLVVPHRVLGGERFSERKEVKDLLAYLKVITNRADLLSLRRIINVPRRGIGKLTLSRVQAHAEDREIGFLAALRDAEAIEDLPKNSKTKILNFCEQIDDLNSKLGEFDAAEMLDQVIERTNYIEDIHQQNVADRDAREAVVKELQAFAREFCEQRSRCTTGEFLRETSLRVDADRYDPTLDVVHLMTVPVSRGLTFPHVILAGAEEGVFPRSDEPGEIEAERRLFHVAISRSSESVIICHARNRKRAGTGFRGEPSRFIAEIPDDLREHLQTFSRETEIFDAADKQELPPPGAGEWVRFEIGNRVRHAEWGEGTVLETEGLGQDLKLQIQFETIGLKKLLLRYAKLEKVS